MPPALSSIFTLLLLVYSFRCGKRGLAANRRHSWIEGNTLFLVPQKDESAKGVLKHILLIFSFTLKSIISLFFATWHLPCVLRGPAPCQSPHSGLCVLLRAHLEIFPGVGVTRSGWQVKGWWLPGQSGVSEGRVLGGGGPIRRGIRACIRGLAVRKQSPQQQRQALALPQTRNSQRQWQIEHREGGGGREGEGREKMVKILHDINKCMMCTSVPVGLCVMSLSCWCVNSVVSELKGPGECFYGT